LYTISTTRPRLQSRGIPENFQVLSPDPHNFDRDSDCIGCESGSNAPDDDSDDDGDGGEGGDDDKNGDNAEGNPNEFDDCIVPPGSDPGDVGC
jgi:hypothetical protein